jgi:hypothetical protein
MLAGVLANLDPRLREQLEQRLGGTAQQFAAGGGGEALLKVMQERRARAMGAMQMSNKQRNKLSLGKDWHGVHYLLSGLAEPAESLLSQAVLGGKPLGDDDEGFSGYGPARYFNVQQVAKVTASLNQPEVETDARARFNSDEMNRLQIYPGWRSEDAEELMNAVRRLREFFASATDNGNAIVTCLV